MSEPAPFEDGPAAEPAARFSLSQWLRQNVALSVSAVLHVALLAAALVSLPHAEPFAPAEESLAVEVVTPEELAAISKGEKTAPKAEEARVHVDTVGEEKPDDDPTPNVDKQAAAAPPPPLPPSREPTPTPPTPPQEVAQAEPTPTPPAPPKTAPEPPKPAPAPPKPAEPPKPAPKPPEPPKPAPKPPEPKPIPKAESQQLDDLALKAAEDKPEDKTPPDPPKPDPKKVEEKKPEEKPRDVMAEAQAALEKQAEADAKAKAAAEKAAAAKAAADAKAQAKAEAKAAEKAAAAAKAAAQAQADSKSFDASKIASLLSKDKPSRAARTGAQVSSTASLGAATGTAPKLSLSQKNAIIGQIISHVSPCWSPPSYAADASQLVVMINVDLNADGTLAADPAVTKYTSGRTGAAAASAAMRALKRCITAQSPLKLPPDLYASWKALEINFDPRQMAGG